MVTPPLSASTDWKKWHEPCIHVGLNYGTCFGIWNVGKNTNSIQVDWLALLHFCFLPQEECLRSKEGGETHGEDVNQAYKLQPSPVQNSWSPTNWQNVRNKKDRQQLMQPFYHVVSYYIVYLLKILNSECCSQYLFAYVIMNKKIISVCQKMKGKFPSQRHCTLTLCYILPKFLEKLLKLFILSLFTFPPTGPRRVCFSISFLKTGFNLVQFYQVEQ